MQAAALVPAPSRLVLRGRAAVLGTVALASGLLSHAAGGGRLPAPPLLALLLLGSVLLATRVVRVRRTPTGIVLLVLAGQTLAHAVLSALAGHEGQRSTGPSVLAPVVPATGMDRTGSLFDHYNATYAPPPGVGTGAGDGSALPLGWLGHQVDHLVDQGPAMVLAHLAGAVLLGLFLAVGEGALWRLLLLAAARARVTAVAWRLALVAGGVRRGVELAGARQRPVAPQPRVSQVLDRRGPRHRGPPFVLAA